MKGLKSYISPWSTLECRSNLRSGATLQELMTEYLSVSCMGGQWTQYLIHLLWFLRRGTVLVGHIAGRATGMPDSGKQVGTRRGG